MYTPYLQDPQQLQQQQQQQPTITTKYMHFLYNFNKLLGNNPSLKVGRKWGTPSFDECTIG